MLWQCLWCSRQAVRSVSSVQTFLPHKNFAKSARCLDRQRLGKQRVEVLQMLRAIAGIKKGWRNHSATRMWRGHERSLARYGVAICDEWISRGYRDTCRAKIIRLGRRFRETGDPSWLGGRKFHASHRASLLKKNRKHYKQFGWKEKPGIDYVWPVPKSIEGVRQCLQKRPRLRR